MAYHPIENYGLIGNMRTCALVGIHGAIDWFCYPYFDSPSLFGAILDDKKGGVFDIHPTGDSVSHKQFYWPDTNILVTRFLAKCGVGEILDYMPVAQENTPPTQIVRSVCAIHGEMTFRVRCKPAFDYARAQHTLELGEDGAIFKSETLTMHLRTTCNDQLEIHDYGVDVEITLREGERAHFIFGEEPSDTPVPADLTPSTMDALFDQTVHYWRDWLSQCTYDGRWRETIYRSALVLKLLTFAPTGAIIAAPTTSLPEGIGGERNWDYRYTWVRDAAFTVYALMRIGFTGEARAFMGWITARCYEAPVDGAPLQPMYGIDGRKKLHEETLDHLDGYKGSRPVRIGNAAYTQNQMDIYGELIDAVYLYNKYGSFISYELWTKLRELANWLCDNWRQKDLSIWEIRGEPGVFTYSRVMSWVALDRMLRLADKRSFPANRDRWRQVRDEIYDEIMQKGWDEERQAFVQRYDDDALDAANLIMPLVFFVAADDPRMLKTLDEIAKPIDNGGLTSGDMVYRYNVMDSPDGLPGGEGMFNMCTFWMIEALTRAQQLDKARIIFERMLTNANHLGLFAEQMGSRGEALGNFPQAFTHLSLISAAFNLDRALKGYRQRV